MGKLIPKDWDKQIHATWMQGDVNGAIQEAVGLLNSFHEEDPPASLAKQLGYYLAMKGDFRSAAAVLSEAHKWHPTDLDVLVNLTQTLSQAGSHADAIQYGQKALKFDPENFSVLDGLTNSHYRLGDPSKAAEYGTQSLLAKDGQAKLPLGGFEAPDTTPDAYLRGSRRTNVIAFSLWGNNPRYLRGAIDNCVAASKVYPNWSVHIYHDSSVPRELLEVLQNLGAVLRERRASDRMERKLMWRFEIADDPMMGRFLVRDIDSVLNDRERAAVDHWCRSDRWFHVMRDWWTHTDLMLAGMWGGIAGVLPPVTSAMESYVPRTVATPHWDQNFLRDVVWGHIKNHALVHDRYFHVPGTSRWPTSDPPGNEHVGQDQFAARRDEQAMRLSGWISRLPCLRS